ncbi:MAG: AAA family ATPase [Oscillospiraceae bacterium]|nr:AAA family ATPase [Oscillospiraceae bacterium]
MESIKINALEFENVKRIRAVALEPAASGLTVIGGNNNQGKTSILDTIAWALGGDRYKPSNPVRDGSVLPPMVKITLSNGLVVERSGKNSALKVTDPNGKRSGQQLLNSFVEELALNLPKFMEAPNREKANTLLQIIGVGDQLRALERQETDLYNRRRMIGQEADRKKKFALEMPFYPDAPKEPVSAYELIQRQQAILARNGENQRKRQIADRLDNECHQLARDIVRQEAVLKEMNEQYELLIADLETARKSAEDLHDESTAQIEQDLMNIEAINIKVRANSDRERSEQEAQRYQEQYDALTGELESTRQAKVDLLNGAVLPLEGLSVEAGELTYHGKKWDGMSGSDQLKVATAIVRALNPRCGFVLLDKLEQMDLNTLREFGNWLQSQNLQAIATRVSTGSECTIIIDDGQVAGESLPPVMEPPVRNTWKAGVF